MNNNQETITRNAEELFNEYISLGKRALQSIQFPLSGDVIQYIHAMFERVGQFGLFNVNITNSKKPAVEYSMLSEWSYGRQIGRIIDVMVPMVDHLKSTIPQGNNKKEILKAIEDFEELKNVLQNKREQL